MKYLAVLIFGERALWIRVLEVLGLRERPTKDHFGHVLIPEFAEGYVEPEISIEAKCMLTLGYQRLWWCPVCRTHFKGIDTRTL